MKIFFKRNILLIISFLTLIGWCFYGVQIHSVPHKDPILYFYNVISNDMYILPLIAPVFVIAPSIYNFHKDLHSGYIKNCLSRESYNKYMLNNYKKSILTSMILPIFIIIFMIMCCIKMQSLSFGSGVVEYEHIASPEIKYASIIYIFMLVYLIGMILNSIFYTNLGLLFCKKNSNYFVSVILAYLTFIGIDIIMETFVGGIILASILNIHYMQDSLNLFSVWDYSGVKSLSFCLIYYLILVIVSAIGVYLVYHNKENVLYEIEK